MSFVGGGSDLPAFYLRDGGAVLSATINRYVYIGVNKRFDSSVRVSYSRTEEVATAAEVQHPLVREALQRVGVHTGIEITSVADIPSRGTGLGSSSAFCVGLLHALLTFRRHDVSRADLAEGACEIEIDRCGAPIGKQDQYAAAFGGLNVIRFRPDRSVAVEHVAAGDRIREELSSRLLFLYTGRSRSAADTLRQQHARTETDARARAALCRMVTLVDLFAGALVRRSFDDLGEMLHESWRLKKTLADGISCAAIDDVYARALKAGAQGGKLLGAGAGGFLMFLAPPDRHDAIRAAVPELRAHRFDLQPNGTQVVFQE